MSLINFLKYRYCKSRMVAFIHSELSSASRQRVARYIDECSACYAEYAHQKNIQRKLIDQIPVLGQPKPDQLDRMWAAIQGEMQPSQPRVRPLYPTRYGLVTLALMLMLIMPLIFQGGRVSLITVTQPTPNNIQSINTDRTPNAIGVVAVATQVVDLTDEVNNSILPEAAPKRTPGSRE